MVGMKCCTPCATVGQLKLGVVIPGNSARWQPNLSLAEAMASSEMWLVRMAREQGRRGGVQRYHLHSEVMSLSSLASKSDGPFVCPMYFIPYVLKTRGEDLMA